MKMKEEKGGKIKWEPPILEFVVKVTLVSGDGGSP